MRPYRLAFGPHGAQPAQRRTAYPHDGVHHDHAVGEVLGAVGLQRDRESGDSTLLIVVADHVDEPVLDFLAVPRIHFQCICGPSCVRPCHCKRRGHRFVVAIGRGLRVGRGSQ